MDGHSGSSDGCSSRGGSSIQKWMLKACVCTESRKCTERGGGLGGRLRNTGVIRKGHCRQTGESQAREQSSKRKANRCHPRESDVLASLKRGIKLRGGPSRDCACGGPGVLVTSVEGGRKLGDRLPNKGRAGAMLDGKCGRHWGTPALMVKTRSRGRRLAWNSRPCGHEIASPRREVTGGLTRKTLNGHARF